MPFGREKENSLEAEAAKLLILLSILVGAAGFELATLWSQTRCATRLRYAPTAGIVAATPYSVAVDVGNCNCRETSMHCLMCCSQTNLSAEKVSAADNAWPAMGTNFAAC